MDKKTKLRNIERDRQKKNRRILRDTNEDKIKVSANVWFCKMFDNHGGLAVKNLRFSLLMLS